MLKPTLPIMLLGLALSMPAEATRSYGPVKDQDTLWNIATQLRPDKSATVQQTMLALYYKNPQAFASNNINSLMKNVVLKAPTSAEARRYQRLSALREARKHNTYWKRGAQLPRTAPPPVPKLKELTTTQRSKPEAVKTSSHYAPTPKSTHRRITRLQAQLQAVESKNQRLTAELQALQAKQSKSKPNPQLDAQVKKLKIELQELTSVLGQKDNHIKTLQTSLKNASETIKSQHADNMRLYDKLKVVSPSSVPASPSAEGKSALKLTTVEAATAAVTSAAAVKAATDINEATAKSAEPSTDTSTATNSAQNINGNTPASSTESQDKTAKSVWADEQTTTNADKSAKPTIAPTETKTTDSNAVEIKTSNTLAFKPSTEPQTLAAVPSTTTPIENTANEPTKPEDAKVNTETTKPDATLTNPTTTQPTALTTTQTAEAKGATDTSTGTGDGDVAKQTPSTASTSAEPAIKAPSNAQIATTLAPTNDVKISSSVPVSQMLAQSGHQAGKSDDQVPSNSAPLRGVSPLALAVALISLLFILALVWRAFLQQREMRRLEKEETQMAERMRKRLDDNQSSAATTVSSVVDILPALKEGDSYR